jgi:Fe-S cluster assembly protein SufD
VFAPTERVAALAFAGVTQALVVTVPAESRPDKPVSLAIRGEGGSAYGHFTLDVGAHADATVVVDHVGTATYAANLEVRLGDGARLTLVSVQDWDDDAVHLEHQVVRVGRDATFKSVVVTLGGDLVRLNPIVRFAGPGGDAELLGVFFAADGQHLEHRLLVEHDQPRCRSRVTYKGALQGDRAHTVWIGDVVIRAEAVGTDTYELNRNLLLTDGARADSVPNLEIETGEVTGAGHASATGRFDDEQLFYLMARGIDEKAARRLVVRGFFADVIARIGLPDIETRLMAAVDDELARSPM